MSILKDPSFPLFDCLPSHFFSNLLSRNSEPLRFIEVQEMTISTSHPFMRFVEHSDFHSSPSGVLRFRPPGRVVGERRSSILCDSTLSLFFLPADRRRWKSFCEIHGARCGFRSDYLPFCCYPFWVPDRGRPFLFWVLVTTFASSGLNQEDRKSYLRREGFVGWLPHFPKNPSVRLSFPFPLGFGTFGDHGLF